MNNQNILINARQLVENAIRVGLIVKNPENNNVEKPKQTDAKKTIKNQIRWAKRRDGFFKQGLNSKGKPYKFDPKRFSHIKETDKNKRKMIIRDEWNKRQKFPNK